MIGLGDVFGGLGCAMGTLLLEFGEVFEGHEAVIRFFGES